MKQFALITGASSGIGEAFAYQFAKNQWNLILTARRLEKLEQIKKDIQAKYPEITIHTIKKDLTQHDSAKSLYKDVHALGLEVDVLVNNAGFGKFGEFAESEFRTNQEMMTLNMNALVELTHFFLQDFKAVARRKNILNVASTAAFQPGPLMSLYYATKAFVLSFSEGIAEELSDTNVKVSVLCPGATTSGFQANASMENSGLVKGQNLPTSEEVAEYGYHLMLSADTVGIHGLKNKVLAMANRFLPRTFVRKAVRRAQQEVE
jgi:short-subunit dehydrogenase